MIPSRIVSAHKQSLMTCSRCKGQKCQVAIGLRAHVFVWSQRLGAISQIATTDDSKQQFCNHSSTCSLNMNAKHAKTVQRGETGGVGRFQDLTAAVLQGLLTSAEQETAKNTPALALRHSPSCHAALSEQTPAAGRGFETALHLRCHENAGWD